MSANSTATGWLRPGPSGRGELARASTTLGEKWRAWLARSRSARIWRRATPRARATAAARMPVTISSTTMSPTWAATST